MSSEFACLKTKENHTIPKTIITCFCNYTNTPHPSLRLQLRFLILYERATKWINLEKWKQLNQQIELVSQSQNWFQLSVWFQSNSPRLAGHCDFGTVSESLWKRWVGGSGIPPLISADCHTTVTEPSVCSHTVHWSQHTWQHLSNQSMSSFILLHRKTNARASFTFW